MSLWKFQKSALPSVSGANTKAGLLTGGTPFTKSKSFGMRPNHQHYITKRNLILTPSGWIRRIIKKNVHGVVRVMDEHMVEANPGYGLTYASNTHMRYPSISEIYVSANSTGGSALQRSATANVYVVFNQAINQITTTISTVAVAVAGSKYTVNDVLRLVGGTGQGGRVTVAAVTSNHITSETISNTGSGYLSGVVYTTAIETAASGDAANATFTVASFAEPGGTKLLLANVAGGNTMRSVAGTTRSNTSIINANNTLVFRFKPGVAGFYKVEAQTLANASATAISLKSYNTNASANLVLTGAAANTAARKAVANVFYTFSVRSATSGG